jgi:hypothetical protein
MPASYPIASELSYLVLEKRRRESELAPCPLDSVNQRLYGIPFAVERHAFMADRESIVDGFQGERPFPRQCDLIRLPHVRRRERK